MKKYIVLFIAALLSTTAQAQISMDPLDVSSFYKQHRIYARNIKDNSLISFWMIHTHDKYELIDNKTYAVYYLKDNQDVDTLYYRQEGKKIYRYDEATGNDILMFDFSLIIGDVFTTENGVKMIVEDVGIFKEYLEYWLYRDDFTMIKLRGVDNPEIQDVWAEGVGSIYTGLLPADMLEGRDSFSVEICNMVSSSAVFPQNRETYKSMPIKIKRLNVISFNYLEHFDEFKEEFVYEFIDDTLHVYGYTDLNCYTYMMCCDISDNKIDLNYFPILADGVDDLECLSLGFFEVFIPGFEPGTYTITMKGKDPQTVVNHTGDYCPFISDNKVWKVGWFPDGGDVTKRLAYYYFDGDTIVGGKQAKRLMCRWEAAPDYAFADESLTYTEYVAAVYENNRQVYFAGPETTEFYMWYDFGAKIGDSFYIGNSNNDPEFLCTVISKGIKDSQTFKGNYIQIGFGPKDEDGYSYGDRDWLEGIGGSPTPLDVFPIVSPTCKCDYYYLLSCKNGDELIYQDYSGKIDGVTPDDDEAKRRIDFTHTIKTQPKSPRFHAAINDEESVSGEYNRSLLFVDLGMLRDNYEVSIVNPSGQIVYNKDVKAGSVLALNIDISEYTNSDYTITLENDQECFSGVFNLSNLVGIESISSNHSIKGDGKIFDLTGRRLNTVPEKGMYIKDGRKYLIKK